MKNWTFSQKATTPQTSDIYFPNTWTLLSQKMLRNSVGHFFCLEYKMERHALLIHYSITSAQQVLTYACVTVCGQPENLPSYILLQHPECYRMFQNACIMFQMFQNVPQCMQNVPECMQNVPECMQNVPECSRMHVDP